MPNEARLFALTKGDVAVMRLTAAQKTDVIGSEELFAPGLLGQAFVHAGGRGRGDAEHCYRQIYVKAKRGRSAQKRALGEGDRSLAWRLDDQSPRPYQRRQRPYTLMLRPSNASDVKAAPALLKRAKTMRYLLGDKGDGADRLRRLARNVGAIRAGATARAPFATTSLLRWTPSY
jgi:hypothetical protein